MFLLLVSLILGCNQHTPDDSRGSLLQPYESPTQYGAGGATPPLTLPFRSGEYWMVTQGFNTGSHIDYHFTYGNDSYALDFSQSGCDAYGKDVTPLMDGTVYRVGTEGSSYDQGYGNNVLVESDDGYVSRYGHLSAIYVEEGQSVTTNDALGAVGNTGNVSGTACAEHPGTHLHLALYNGTDAIEPEPLSGTQMNVGCWYNREGQESCSGNPGDYTPVDGEGQTGGSTNGDNSDGGDTTGVIGNDSDGLNVAFLDISPQNDGVNGTTNYVWVATVVSDSGQPSVNLEITNPSDGVTYEFPMTTASVESPWVFTYQKALRDASSYPYWVVAEEGGRTDTSSEQTIRVNDDIGELPEFLEFGRSLVDRDAQWSALVGCSDGRPAVTLKIVNPNDATIYSFDMDVEDNGDNEWYASYEKTMSDATVYPYWFEATGQGGTQTSELQSLVTE